MKNKKIIITIVFFASSLFLASFVLTLQNFSLLDSFRFVFGAFFVLFIPGFVWSFVLTRNNAEANLPVDQAGAENAETIGCVDRIILSFGLSFVMSPLTVFILSKIGIRITFLSCLFEILSLIIIGLAVILFQNKIIKNKNA